MQSKEGKYSLYDDIILVWLQKNDIIVIMEDKLFY